jgi:hypothetical protein
MHFPMRHAPTAVLLCAIGALPVLAQEQTSAVDDGGARAATDVTSHSGPTKTLTGKERLGEKWTDEQRIDNCKVPPEKRGPLPRPDTCALPPPS